MESSQSALPRPPGVIPDHTHDVNASRTLWLSSCAMMAGVSTIFVAIRLYTRFRVQGQYSLSDASCTLGWVFSMASLAMRMNLLRYGIGYHGWEITTKLYASYAQMENDIQILYMPGIFFIKTAILLQFLKMFVTRTHNARWWILYSIIAANAVFYTILLFLEIFECWPRERIWDKTIPGSCIDINQTFVATGIINVLDDFLILLLPLVWIWRLNIRKGRKMVIIAIFAAGLFIMRLKESVMVLSSRDITYTLLPVSLWGSAELTSGIIVSCLPVIPRLFRHRYSTNTNATATRSSYREPLENGVPLSTYRPQYESLSDYPTIIDTGPETWVYAVSPRPRTADTEAANIVMPPPPALPASEPATGNVIYLDNTDPGTDFVPPPPAIHRKVEIKQTSA